MRELLGEEAIGDFDQIIIDHDNDGSIIVTKKRKVLQVLFSGFSNLVLKLFANNRADETDVLLQPENSK